jgi:putative DNA primase/helicase
MNQRELLNHVFAKITDNLKKLEPKKDKEGNTIPRTALEYSTEILKQTPNKIIAYTGRIQIYYNGRYIPINSMAKTENFIKKCLMKLKSGRAVSVKLISAVLNELFTEFHELYIPKNSNITYINMKSNVLVIQKDGKIEVLPHDEKYNFTYQLPYDYDENATSPIFDKFLKTSLVDEDLKDVLGEFLGYVLDNNSKKYEKAFFAYGDGSNGKSTLINIIKALFGVENISVVEITDMGDMLKCALMDGKLLNISSDARRNGLETSAFKKIVSGEPVLGKYLFKDIYTIENLPKLFVATNKLPFQNGDNSFGYYRRLLLIPFKNIIKDEDKDYELESKVIANELPAILNFAIKGMQRLNEQGQFTEAVAMKEAMNTYKESSNHVASFIEEEQYEVVDASLKKGTSLIDLFTDFKRWCQTHGHNPYSSSYLSHELEHLGYIAYKNSSKHFRIVKNKLKNETGFKPNKDDDYE